MRRRSLCNVWTIPTDRLIDDPSSDSGQATVLGAWIGPWSVALNGMVCTSVDTPREAVWPDRRHRAHKVLACTWNVVVR
ncbi:hypothetical protein CGGC5_v001930 [Colletotrichum fructicola Nara gc5]|uniref:Uncharacterized protein n=1 Tax=Colletotrichum fructicola (strain Nara gc5) TaxID=1213859 RepID=A0A7J6JMD5_COLFN|nr:hypothetical protein CGGC5_v001930 [Colletotrichum fructicola Nara gc5]KAF4897426.1 hypothetical protein CGCFRS4_v004951 [Colletotrichum fructicola]